MVDQSGKEFSVYFLYCLNKEHLGDVYIGYTVDHKRRLKQHNLGTAMGGAKKTSKKGPWEMVLILKHFPSEIAALKFEWSWQKASKFKAIVGQTGRKKRNESKLAYNMRLLDALLNVPPWNRAPIEVHILHPEYFSDLSFLPNCPEQIEVITSNGETRKCSPIRIPTQACCTICSALLTDHIMSCYHEDCTGLFHINCLADHLTQDTYHVLPTKGVCPRCKKPLIWGKLVRSATLSEAHETSPVF